MLLFMTYEEFSFCYMYNENLIKEVLLYMLPYIITAVVSILVSAVVVWFISDFYHKKAANSKIGNAEEKARQIIDEAVKTAETKNRNNRSNDIR